MKLQQHIQFLFVLIGVLCSLNATAQLENAKSRSSLGPMFGGSYYIGDLNPYQHFKNTNFSAGIIYRYHINSRLAARVSLTYGKVEGYDFQSNHLSQQARNLSFESTLFEAAGGVEFNFLNYQLGNKDYWFTPYIFLELGAFRMNPKTEYNDEIIELQPIGTEGQNSSLSDKKSYSLFQVSIPVGVGFKMNLGKRVVIGIEYGIRKTFTDYLDDVGEGKFIDRVSLAQENGDLAATLSDRSSDDVKMTGPRGNPSTKDWYSMFHFMITFSLGDPSKCHFTDKL